MSTRTAHFKLFTVDETNQWWEGIAKYAKPIKGVYLIDVNEKTYCCELTPSYTGYFLYSVYENPFDDERLDAEIQEGDAGTESISYFHVHSVKEFVHDFGEEKGIDREEYDEYVEAMIEHCNANSYV